VLAPWAPACGVLRGASAPWCVDEPVSDADAGAEAAACGAPAERVCDAAVDGASAPEAAVAELGGFAAV
jgi:hypothetical protein